MAIYSVVPLVCVIAYGVLSIIVARHLSTRTRRLFAVYLLLCLIFAIGTYMALSNSETGHLRFWASLLPIGSISVLVAYYHFVSAFIHTSNRLLVILGYGFVLFALIPLAALGYLPQNVQLTDAGLDIDYGAFLYMISIIGSILVGLSIFLMVRRLRVIHHPTERGRIIY